VTAALEAVRDELIERRERLAGLAVTVRESQLVDLLRQVDSAIERLDGGSWGRCSVCLGTVEAERLAADPLLTVCLECLSPAERKALERDLETAAQVQAALLPPRRLGHGGWEVALLWEPLGAVSGDHYDLLKPSREEDPLHLVVGDASGKGVSASLVQSHLHALLRALADLPLPALLSRANRLLCEVTLPAHYATLLAARLYGGGRVELANAGHPRPLLADRRGVRRSRAAVSRSASSARPSTPRGTSSSPPATPSSSTPMAGPRPRPTRRSTASAAPPPSSAASRTTPSPTSSPPAAPTWRTSWAARRAATT
jgi:RNA polymerase-binding transcription factor DksA